MADNTLQQLQGFNPELQDITNQREMAKLLIQKGMQAPQGQMVGNRYVGAHPFQYLGNLAQGWVGKGMAEEADKKQQALAEKLRMQNAVEAQGIIGALTGSPEVKETTYGAGEEGPTVNFARPAVAPNPQLALSRALISQGTAGQMMLPSIMKQVMPEEYTLGEGQIRYKQMPDGSVQVMGKGGEKLHSVGDTLVTSGGQVVYKGQSAGHVLETPNGAVLVDIRSGATRPLLDNKGQPLQGTKGLTEAEGKATNYALSMVNATNDMKTLEAKGFNPASLKSQSALSASGTTLGNIAASPETQQYKQAMDNFANAYLRFQSGANMSEPEIQRNLKNMMPAIGDSPEQLAQKSRARDVAMQGIAIAAGQGARNIPKVANPKAPEASINLPSSSQAKPAFRWNPSTGNWE